MEQSNHTIDCGEFMSRRWRPREDFEVLFRLIEESLDHLRPWMSWVAHHSRRAAADFLANCGLEWTSGQAYNYSVSIDGVPIGACSLIRTTEPQGREAGYGCIQPPQGEGLLQRQQLL
ncbi:hypothetical protein [Streptomyces sp. 8N616]|uniref:hypothetical protein n=1 Tax=Streptomyces sp. 8N616 TaxID=3457414 RepID=UPI003FD4A38E